MKELFECLYGAVKEVADADKGQVTFEFKGMRLMYEEAGEQFVLTIGEITAKKVVKEEKEVKGE